MSWLSKTIRAIGEKKRIKKEMKMRKETNPDGDWKADLNLMDTAAAVSIDGLTVESID